MIVRKFEAPSLEQALARIKLEMGPEALILETKQVGRSWFRKASVEVTAASQNKNASSDAVTTFDEDQLAKVFPHRRQTAAAGQGAPSPPSEPEARKSIRKSPLGRYRDLAGDSASGMAARPAPSRASSRSAASEHRFADSRPSESPEEGFLALGFSAETSRDFARQLIFDYTKEDRADLALMDRVKAKLLAAGIRSLRPEIFEARRCWAAIGMAGAGKTSLLVKLALFLQARKQGISLVSCDRRKLIGKQEFAAYAKLLRAPFSTNPHADKTASRVTLIDTPSLVWKDDTVLTEIDAVCRDASSVVVLDASQRLAELMAVVEKSARFAPVALAFTRLDNISQAGVVYEVLKSSKLPLLGLSLSQSFAVPFRFFEPTDLARLLIGGESGPVGNA